MGTLEVLVWSRGLSGQAEDGNVSQEDLALPVSLPSSAEVQMRKDITAVYGS